MTETALNSEKTCDPKEECDLVMKGGITSGIVYPPAILELAKQYRFRSIGGTSAGAIAAAIAAAAEYARASGGFGRLQELSDELSKGSFVRDLFQPTKETRPLLEVPSYAMKGPKAGPMVATVRRIVRGSWALLLQTPIGFLLGVLFGGSIPAGLSDLVNAIGVRPPTFIVNHPWISDTAVVFFSVLFAWAFGILGGGVWLASIFFRKLPSQRFGICLGHRRPGERGTKPILTDWLSMAIDYISGKVERLEDAIASDRNEPPLTFGDLEGRGIQLRMVTTNLSLSRPYLLPFQEHRFIFSKKEMEEFFPRYVVNYMSENAGADYGPNLPEGYYYLPDPDKLPVIVATRMSLSFSVLIAAVPVYALKASAAAATEQDNNCVKLGDLQRHWLSDGGLSSNFPINLFDSWLPGRPTFGINLTYSSADAFDDDRSRLKPDHLSRTYRPTQAMPTDGEAGRDAVRLPKADEQVLPEWDDITSVFSFLNASFFAAKDFHDTLQAELPSYRERIVQIRLDKNEGGLNLDMPSSVIDAVQSKGQCAGKILCTEFSLPIHQWTRLLVLMEQVERNFQKVHEALASGSFDVTDLMKRANKVELPFPHEQGWSDQAATKLQELFCLVRVWERNKVFEKSPPEPPSALRVTPDF